MTNGNLLSQINPSIRSLRPGNRYIAKRLVKVTINVSLLDLFILVSFGLMTLIPFDEVDQSPQDIRLMIWIMGLVTVLLISITVFLYSIIGIPWLIKTLSYEITEEALVVRRGRLTKVEIFVPYRTMTNVGLTKGPFDRLFNIGHLSVETAGTSLTLSGKMGVDQYIEGLEDDILGEVYDYIYTRMKKLKGIYSTTTEDNIEESIGESKEGDISNLIKDLTDEIRELRKTVAELQK
ncbi:MAG: PH domain-containing protein [Candidatus Odinarchaeota archaeon]